MTEIDTSQNPLKNYRVDFENLLLLDNKIPLIHWPVAPNFGDALSPWLIEKLTGIATMQNAGEVASYVSIGSIINRVRDNSVVWGTGSFGPEPPRQINPRAEYAAVRGPLTRSLILDRGGKCPRIYGDPALLTPLLYQPPAKKTHEIGVVVRWSDRKWKSGIVGEGVRLIDLGTDDVEPTLDMMLSCEKIITSSLHGLIIADAYGIPNAWLFSSSPKGREYKFYDYFLSVDKVRHSQCVDLSEIELTIESLVKRFSFDGRPINFDPTVLLDACPMLRPLKPPNGQA